MDFLEIEKPCASKDAMSREYRDDGPNTLPNHISDTRIQRMLDSQVNKGMKGWFSKEHR